MKLLRKLGNLVPYTESRFGLLSENNKLFPVFQSFLATRDVVKVLPHLMRLLFAPESFLAKYEHVPISQFGPSRKKDVDAMHRRPHPYLHTFAASRHEQNIEDRQCSVLRVSVPA